MEPIITVNEYPIGWEWLDRVPLEDFTWLIEIFSTITDNTDTYDFATFDKEATNIQVYSIDLEDEPFAAYISGYIITYASAELQAIKPSSTEEEEQLNIELKDIVLKILFGPFYNYFVSEYVVSDTIWEEQDKLIEDLYYYFKS